MLLASFMNRNLETLSHQEKELQVSLGRNTMPLEDLDAAFEGLFEKGFFKKMILGPDGESDHRMTAKAF